MVMQSPNEIKIHNMSLCSLTINSEMFPFDKLMYGRLSSSLKKYIDMYCSLIIYSPEQFLQFHTILHKTY